MVDITWIKTFGPFLEFTQLGIFLIPQEAWRIGSFGPRIGYWPAEIPFGFPLFGVPIIGKRLYFKVWKTWVFGLAFRAPLGKPGPWFNLFPGSLWDSLGPWVDWPTSES